MNAIESQCEITGALTDLALGVIIIPMVLYLLSVKTEKKSQKKWWIFFFAMLDISSVLGFIVHYFCKSELSSKILWIPLFPMLYEVVNCFLLVSVSIYSDGKKPQKKGILTVHIVSLAAYIITQTAIHLYNFDSIRLLTAFNTVFALIGFALILKKSFQKGSVGERILFAALLPLLPAAFFQIKRNTAVKIIWYFDHNGITHIFIIIGIIILFVSVVIMLKPKREKEHIKS